MRAKEKELLITVAKILMASMDYLKPHATYDGKTGKHSKAFTLTGAILNTLDDLEEIVEFDRPGEYQ